MLSIHATNCSLSRLIDAECDDLEPATGTKTSRGRGCGMRSVSSKSITSLQLPSGTQNTGNFNAHSFVDCVSIHTGTMYIYMCTKSL